MRLILVMKVNILASLFSGKRDEEKTGKIELRSLQLAVETKLRANN